MSGRKFVHRPDLSVISMSLSILFDWMTDNCRRARSRYITTITIPLVSLFFSCTHSNFYDSCNNYDRVFRGSRYLSEIA